MGICIYVEERNKKSISCLGGLYFVVAETPEYSVGRGVYGRLYYETTVSLLKESFNDSADYHLLHYWDLKESYHGGFEHLLNIISRENTPSGKSVKQPDFEDLNLRHNTEFFLPGNNPDIGKVVELIDLFFVYNTWSSLQEKVVSLEQKVIDYENLNSKMEEFGSTSRAIEYTNKKLKKAKDDLEFYRSASDEQLNKRLKRSSLKKLYYYYNDNGLFLTTLSILPVLWVGLVLGMFLLKLAQAGY